MDKRAQYIAYGLIAVLGVLISLGAYARILFILGMLQRLIELADPKFDELGLGLEAKNLPKRIRIPKKEKKWNKKI